MSKELKGIIKLLLVLFMLTVLAVLGLLIFQMAKPKRYPKVQSAEEILSEIKSNPYSEIDFAAKIKPSITEDFLPINPYSRSGDKLEDVNAIVIHYVGNPGTTGRQNRSYFEEIATTHEASRSSHFVIGLDGEIIQCMPLDEVSYASNERNNDTISIECCHPDKSGDFTKATYDSLVELTAYLMVEYDLDLDGVLRHYDITGKHCPKYFVDEAGSWNDFLFRVSRYLYDMKDRYNKL